MTTGFFAGRKALRCRCSDRYRRTAGLERTAEARDRRQRNRRLVRPGRRQGEHHATAVTPAGKKACNKRLPNSETKLREVLRQAPGPIRHRARGDRPARLDRCPADRGRPRQGLRGCLSAWSDHAAIADLYRGEAKTDARDVFIIADAARAMPHTLRSIELANEIVAEPEMIVGFDDCLAGEAIRISNRLRGLLGCLGRRKALVKYELPLRGPWDRPASAGRRQTRVIRCGLRLVQLSGAAGDEQRPRSNSATHSSEAIPSQTASPLPQRR